MDDSRRRQFHSCDPCRRGKRRCDAPVCGHLSLCFHRRLILISNTSRVTGKMVALILAPTASDGRKTAPLPGSPRSQRSVRTPKDEQDQNRVFQLLLAILVLLATLALLVTLVVIAVGHLLIQVALSPPWWAPIMPSWTRDRTLLHNGILLTPMICSLPQISFPHPLPCFQEPRLSERGWSRVMTHPVYFRGI